MQSITHADHFRCVNPDQGPKPPIEKVKILKGSSFNESPKQNLILFFMKGRMSFSIGGSTQNEGMKGQAFLLPVGETVSYEVLSDTELIIFRIQDAIMLCESFTPELLCGIERHPTHFRHVPESRNFASLEINPKLGHFLEGIQVCLEDGMLCKNFLELKIKEFFHLLSFYYPKNEALYFISFIHNRDIAFSGFVRLQWKEYDSVGELAAAMNMSKKQFTRKFATVFGTTPYKWIKEGKARGIYQELITTSKAYKLIADEYGLGSVQYFNSFVKGRFGKTPGEIRTGQLKSIKNVKKRL